MYFSKGPLETSMSSGEIQSMYEHSMAPMNNSDEMYYCK